jgi:hypothetical protein
LRSYPELNVISKYHTKVKPAVRWNSQKSLKRRKKVWNGDDYPVRKFLE